jgi:predicted RNase H-like HicB family nuclease
VTHYIAIVEEEEGKAVGLWFPDLPGCFSAGDTLEEAMLNAREALVLYAEHLGRPMPPPRTLNELKAEPETTTDLQTHMVALVPFEPELLQPAAE